jgi:hypothetical protein
MLLIEMKAFASRMAIDFLGAYIVEYYNRSIQGLLLKQPIPGKYHR